VGFASFDRAGQAAQAHRAGLAICLGELQFGRQAREPQLRILAVAGQRVIQCLRLRGSRTMELAMACYRPELGAAGSWRPDRAWPALGRLLRRAIR
jgi:hypothetical protein